MLFLFDKFADYIISRMPENISVKVSVLIGIVIIALIIFQKLFFNISVADVRARIRILIQNIRGKDEIKSLAEERAEIQSEIIKAKKILERKRKYFESEIDRTQRTVANLKVLRSYKDRHDQAIRAVSTLKKLSEEQNSEIENILSAIIKEFDEAKRMEDVKADLLSNLEEKDQYPDND